ncbi:MAG: hypothetical protein COX62_06250 [Deltaproteobacteria bacterium CG_4_10_14_0_2_um_filter_43_8]|nr:MAG: hypothetical protein COV43_07500 [Deltaproteobacteria bacterium CG11_big_fil_rev_8_21_14_0_20_42_23]PJA19653.1 MAG: hypothetical protein COX62_06250 [Deltaproteobacteria bacterium CG_4_10_14_0_2_um_filter_43_8]PJC63718.1 MAG: hypothetical protein CO021_08055 [Deltaproteobacteria bacterium CG_4_9_14_0_2_um_filter_42_21]
MLKDLAQFSDLILQDDPRIEHYREDTMYRGNPEAVVRVRDEQELKEVMKYCCAKKNPITFCASQTSMTGSSVADEGILVSLEKLKSKLELNTFRNESIVTSSPGVITADLQSFVANEKKYYPVSPTSRKECTIGANVATNATGEDTFKYGTTRQYVRRLKVLLADGSEKIFEREADEKINTEKNRAGYLADWKNPIDLFIGSEGTLGVITELSLAVLNHAPRYFAMMLPFTSNASALKCIVDIVSQKKFQPKALEMIDAFALRVMKTHPHFPRMSDHAQAIIYLKQEYETEAEKEQWQKKWLEYLEKNQACLTNDILFADTEKQFETFRNFRHHIPTTINEDARKLWPAGGGKVGSDWWVPVNQLLPMMDYFYSAMAEANLPFMVYAHLGNGHPHTNIFCKNSEEKKKARDILKKACKKAVALGGGVAGEHGIGKIQRELLSLQHSQEVIAKMKQWKKEYDPHFLLGRGNIF